MKKVGVAITFAFCLVMLIGFGFAANETTNATTNTTTPSPNVTVSTTANTVKVNASNIDKGFSCLSQQIKSECTGATTVQEIALTIMATPNNTKQCVARLKTFKKTNCFGTGSSCTVKDTSLAIIALNHVGEETASAVSWLKNQTEVSTDLIWQLEQDSNGKSDCELTYDSQEYPFSVLENKKITSAAGSCFSLTQSNYWFQISPACYGKDFSLVCNTDFLATLLYKTPSSQTLYLLSEPKQATANNPVSFKVKSTCFGINSCDYEASLWAVLALKVVGEDVDEYTPYLIAAEELNKQYLPSAFLHMVLDWNDYGTKLIKEQKQTYWEADGTAYDKYYDTSLALIALASSSAQQQVINAKSWLTNYAQGADGCWGNKNIRDTAIALWALDSRTYVSGGPDLVGCTEASASFSCLSIARCAKADQLTNYACGGVGKVCCKSADLQSCSELNGVVCGSGKTCDGVSEASSDSANCCLSGICKDVETLSSCEMENGVCRTSCLSSQKESTLDCGLNSGVCCLAVSDPKPGPNLTWLWILLIVLIIIIALLIVFKERVQIWWFKVRNKVTENKGSQQTNNRPFAGYSGARPMPSTPARPLMPQRTSSPQPRPSAPAAMPQRTAAPKAPAKKPADDEDIFKKLKDMGK